MADTTVDANGHPVHHQHHRGFVHHVENNAAVGHYPLLSWRSVIAGFLIALLCAAILLSLGIAVGGSSLEKMADTQTDAGLGLGSSIWIVFSMLVALFVGCYYAARVSNFITSRVGAAQGLIISALFFGMLILEVMAGIGLAGRGLGGAVGLMGSSAADLAHNPRVQGIVSNIVNGPFMKNDPDIITEGILARLLSGDPEGARNYLAYQTGITREEADDRLNNVAANLQATLQQAATAAARTVTAVGWTVFGLLTLGAFFSALGGALGAKANFRRPIVKENWVPGTFPSNAAPAPTMA